MATHSSVLAWTIPGTGEPGGLPSGVAQIRTRLKRLSNSSSRGSMVGVPGGSEGKASACNVGDLGLIPGSGRSLGEGNGNPLQYEAPW